MTSSLKRLKIRRTPCSGGFYFGPASGCRPHAAVLAQPAIRPERRRGRGGRDAGASEFLITDISSSLTYQMLRLNQGKTWCLTASAGRRRRGFTASRSSPGKTRAAAGMSKRPDPGPISRIFCLCRSTSRSSVVRVSARMRGLSNLQAVTEGQGSDQILLAKRQARLMAANRMVTASTIQRMVKLFPFVGSTPPCRHCGVVQSRVTVESIN